MSDPPDLFKAFRSSSENTPAFFPSFKVQREDQKLRNRLEEVLGLLNDATFYKLKDLASRDFQRAVSEYLDIDSPKESISVNHSSDQKQSIFRNNALTDMKIPVSKTKGRVIDNSILQEFQPLQMESVDNSISDKEELLQQINEVNLKKKSEDLVDANITTKSKSEKGLSISPSDNPAKLWVNECRYLGSFHARPYYTRPGKSWTKHGDSLRIDRIGLTRAKSQDNLQVKFFNNDGLDFARASTEDAIILAPLLDSDICRFEAQVIYVEPGVRVGTTFDVEIQCYFKKQAFTQRSVFNVTERSSKKSIIDEAKETQEERLVRLRQVALVNLFNRVGLSNTVPEIRQILKDVNKSDLSASTSNRSEKSFDGETDLTLDKAQLDFLNSKTEYITQKFSGPGVDPGESFNLTLKPYQKRGLAWMLQCERDISNISEKDCETHPLWTELKWPEEDPFWANLNSGELSLTRPTLASQCRGGILGDEMGLGKTIQVAALIHSGENESKAASTLVVVDKSLLGQWESELIKARKTVSSCGCLLFYEKSDAREIREFLMSRYHKRKVIITTYGKLQSAHKLFLLNKESVLFDTVFDRVILDEAHRIKNRSTLSAKACFDIRSHRRWALTGTPITNRLEDLYSLIRFIGLEPWGTFNYWKSFVTDPFSKLETRFRALKTVQAIVAPIILRRTKEMKDPETGQYLIELPKKTIKKEIIEFTEDERTLYSHLFARIRDSVVSDLLDGKPKYTTILALITQLRQVCCHPALLIRKEKQDTSQTVFNGGGGTDFVTYSKRRKVEESNNDKINEASEQVKVDLTGDIKSMIERMSSSVDEYTNDTLKALLESPLIKDECPICFDEQVQPLFTECLHSACHGCMIRSIKKRSMCPLCNKPASLSRLMVLDETREKLLLYNVDQVSSHSKYQSSKIVALIKALKEGEQQGLGKSLVFSQFASFLNIIEENIQNCGIQVFRFDGSMSHLERDNAIDSFKSSDSENAVLLLTLKAGCVGLNLTEAKRVFLMDPWWNWATEEQACGRVHRVGQDTSVTITRFIIKGSIEERMLKLQEKKSAISSVVTADEDEPKNFEDIKLLLGLDENLSKEETN